MFDAFTGHSGAPIINEPCFGLQVGKLRTFVFTFPSETIRTNVVPHGKIISFIYKNNEVLDIVTECDGINNGTHQIIIYENKLYIQETYFQRIKTYLLDDDEHVISGSEEIIHPFEKDIYNYHYLLQKPYTTKYFIDRHALYRHMNAMTIQDGFIYILSPYIGRAFYKPKPPTIAVFHLDFRPYAEIELPTTSIPHDLVFIGSDAVYVNSDHQVVHFNIFTQTITKTFEFNNSGEEKWQRGLSFDGQNYLVGCGRTVQILNSKGVVTNVHQFSSYPCCITQVNYQNEYNNCLSDCRKSYVETLYTCPSELAIYERCFQDMYNMFNEGKLTLTKTDDIYFKHAFEYYNSIHFASNLQQITNPYEGIFRGHRCMQVLLKPHMKVNKLQTSVLKKHGNLLHNTVANHCVTGCFFVYNPGHGMGWHHNIDTAHFRNTDRWYMVRSNDDSFGASFFLYRHPITHLIHYVPDVNNTIKHFRLSFDTNSPLWHAVVSFRAVRVSFGVSMSKAH